jgi:phosphosulfolactate synthase
VPTEADAYLEHLGVARLAPRTVPFDPGYDAGTIEAHCLQSGHLMAGLKLSMACWQLAAPTQTERKVKAARAAGVPVVTGGGPFEIAVAAGMLDEYLDLCAGVGVDWIEAGSGFTRMPLAPGDVVERAASRGLVVQFEMGGKHDGPFTEAQMASLVALGRRWLDAGARKLVVEARESAQAVGLFDAEGSFQAPLADVLADALGLDVLLFEAPDKRSQFALLEHFGPEVGLSNVRVEELLRVEIYRRGLHSDSFGSPTLGLLQHSGAAG